MEFARPPSEMSFEGPIDVNWRNWKQSFIIYLKASGANNWPTDRKAALLINLIGPVGQHLSNTFSPEDCQDLQLVMEKFDTQFGSKMTEARERYGFFSSVRQNTETIDQYVNTLKIRARNCRFGDLKDSLMRDKIILDVKNRSLRKHLLGEPNLDLIQTIDLWKTYETSEKLTQLCLPKGILDIVKSEYKPSNNLDDHGKSEASSCGRCGTHHDPKHCPAWGQKCTNCGMQNHLAEWCTKSSTSNNNARNEFQAPRYFNSGPFTPIPGCNKKDNE